MQQSVADKINGPKWYEKGRLAIEYREADASLCVPVISLSTTLSLSYDHTDTLAILPALTAASALLLLFATS